MDKIHKKWMAYAIKEAKISFSKKEVPVGGIIVYQNKIIAKGHNQVELLKDPTAHAEMIFYYICCKSFTKLAIERM